MRVLQDRQGRRDRPDPSVRSDRSDHSGSLDLPGQRANYRRWELRTSQRSFSLSPEHLQASTASAFAYQRVSRDRGFNRSLDLDAAPGFLSDRSSRAARSTCRWSLDPRAILEERKHLSSRTRNASGFLKSCGFWLRKLPTKLQRAAKRDASAS